MDMFVKQTLQVTNYGNAPARFSWNFPSKIYVPSPLEDEVPAGGSREVEILFNPPGPRVDEELLLMKIEDGADEELRCLGQVNESKCVFLEKQLTFGNVHVGLRTKDQTIQIKNQLKTTAIFHVENDDPELTIMPRKGRIQGDGRCVFTVSFHSNKEKNYDSQIVVNIRGGKQLILPVRAHAMIPDLQIEEERISFGGVTFGDQKVLPITIMNNSDITAKLELDIRDFPEFELILPDPTADDDIHSEIMVPIHENPKYEDLDKMNLEDVDPLDGEQESSDEDVAEEDQKRHVMLSIRATGRPFELKIKYTPNSVDDPQNFILPLKLAGWDLPIPALQRRIQALGIKPRFFLEPTIVNFKTKVIAKGQKPVPFYQDIQITNPDLKPVVWRIDKDALEESKVFQMNPC